MPAIEPDVRGATTIRDILAAHESDPNCAACHRKIDPAGFALEPFDAAGQWRTDYGGKHRKKLPVDASGVLADGRQFTSFDQFRELVSSDPVPLAKNFVEKLATFATGQDIQFADREIIEQIVNDNKQGNYGVRSLLLSIVRSPIFTTK